MIDIAAAVLKTYQSKIKRVPCHTNRASQIGYFLPSIGGCIRQGVYKRTRWADEEPISPELAQIFEEGRRQERNTLKDLLNADIEVIEQQVAFEIREHEITGHQDGTIEDEGESVPVEIKSMHPNIYDSIRTYADFDKRPHTRAYKVQINLYMYANNAKRGTFILKNKSTGAIKQIDVEYDPQLARECFNTCNIINSYVNTNRLPDRTENRQTCKKCRFKHICLPDVDFRTELRIVDDPQFEQHLDRYHELVDAHKEASELYDTIKAEAKAEALANDGVLNMSIGKYLLTGKTDVRGAFRLKIKP